MKTRIETNLKDHLFEVSLDCSQTNIHSHPQYLREKENRRCCYITFTRQQGKLVQFSTIKRQTYSRFPLKGKKGLKTYHQLIIWTYSRGFSMEFRNMNDFHNSWYELQVLVSKYLWLSLPSSSLSTLLWLIMHFWEPFIFLFYFFFWEPFKFNIYCHSILH